MCHREPSLAWRGDPERDSCLPAGRASPWERSRNDKMFVLRDNIFMLSIRDRFAVVASRISRSVIQLLKKGSGGTWPGEVALRISPDILSHFDFRSKKVLYIAGTNGKTTTASMLETILRKSGVKVKRNDSGANLDNGLVSVLCADTTILGKLKHDVYIFEVDESALGGMCRQKPPDILVLLNLFRDQLDRYGEVDAIAVKWAGTFGNMHATAFVINADDPQLAYIGKKLKNVQYFGLENRELFLTNIQHATDSIYCPSCNQRLTYGGVYFSHLGKYSCGKCGFTHPDVRIQSGDVKSPLEGTYNVYNTLAAVLCARILGVQDQNSLRLFRPAFGRQEEIVHKGKNIKILLSKNPAGFNESLRTVLPKKGPILFLLNDRIPDGTDVSWIWDVDFEMIDGKRKLIVSGDRGYDMALRLKYAGLGEREKEKGEREEMQGEREKEKGERAYVFEDMRIALEKAIELSDENEILWILPTYSAMLEIREILTGRKIN